MLARNCTEYRKDEDLHESLNMSLYMHLAAHYCSSYGSFTFCQLTNIEYLIIFLENLRKCVHKLPLFCEQNSSINVCALFR